MFYEVEMRRQVVVHPHELGSALHTRRALLRRLLQDVERDVGSADLGYFVAVTTVDRVSEGRVRAGSGQVVFTVDFKCIVFHLVKGEVVEAQVSQVTQYGFLASCGPHTVFVPRTEMTGFEFRAGASAEFHEWRDSAGSVLHARSDVRLRVVAHTWNDEKRVFKAAGTLNGDLLGVLPTPEDDLCN